MNDLIFDDELRLYWIKFYNECKELLDNEVISIDTSDEYLSEIDTVYLKEILIFNLSNYRRYFDKVNFSLPLNDIESEFINKFSDILEHILLNHPYISSKFEDIMKIEKGEYVPIKFETLIGNEILNDKLIKEFFIRNRYDLVSMIAKHDTMKHLGVILTLKHIETAIYFNNNNSFNYKFSINISDEEIQSDKFFNKLFNIKKFIESESNSKIGNVIQFELLEYQVDFDNPIIVKGLEKLEQIGIKIAIDDFGTYFSNLKRVTTIRDLESLNTEMINTIKIDKKITSSLCYDKFYELLHFVPFDNHNEMYSHFLYHIANIIDVPYIDVKSILSDMQGENFINLLLELELEFGLQIRKIVNYEFNKFKELINYIINHDLEKNINLVFEFIDNAFVKDIIRDICSDTGIETLVQGYYFEESIKPIYHKDIKDFINSVCKDKPSILKS